MGALRQPKAVHPDIERIAAKAHAQRSLDQGDWCRIIYALLTLVRTSLRVFPGVQRVDAWVSALAPGLERGVSPYGPVSVQGICRALRLTCPLGLRDREGETTLAHLLVNYRGAPTIFALRRRISDRWDRTRRQYVPIEIVTLDPLFPSTLIEAARLPDGIGPHVLVDHITEDLLRAATNVIVGRSRSVVLNTLAVRQICRDVSSSA